MTNEACSSLIFGVKGFTTERQAWDIVSSHMNYLLKKLAYMNINYQKGRGVRVKHDAFLTYRRLLAERSHKQQRVRAQQFP